MPWTAGGSLVARNIVQAAGVVGHFIRRSASTETADLEQWQTETGAVIASVSATGQLRAAAYGALAVNYVTNPNAGGGVTGAAVNNNCTVAATITQATGLAATGNTGSTAYLVTRASTGTGGTYGNLLFALNTPAADFVVGAQYVVSMWVYSISGDTSAFGVLVANNGFGGQPFGSSPNSYYGASTIGSWVRFMFTATATAAAGTDAAVFVPIPQNNAFSAYITNITVMQASPLVTLLGPTVFPDGTVQSTAYKGALPSPFTPPSGNWQQPANMVTAAPGSVTSGQLTLCPFDVGPASKQFNALGVGVTTAQVAGTTTTTLAVYPDNGTGGLPNLVGGPTATGTVVLTTAGNASATIASTLAAGRYWAAFLYVASAAPTTAPQVNAIATGPSLWIPSTTTIGTTSRGLTAAGLSAMPTTQIALSPTGSTVVAVVGIRAL